MTRSPARSRPIASGWNRCLATLREHEIRYHVSAPERTETANLDALLRDIQAEGIDYTPQQAYRRSFGEGRALTAVWKGKPLTRSRALMLGWANDVRRDLLF